MIKKICFLFFVLLFVSLCAPPVSAATKQIIIPLSEDTYIEENFPSISPWNNRNLFLGTDSVYGKGRTRILLKPNFSALNISENQIIKAELQISQYQNEGSVSNASISIAETTTPWSMYSVNWLNQPSIWGTTTTNINTDNSRKSIVITDLFKKIFTKYKQQNIHNGISIRFTTETRAAIILWATGCHTAPSSPQCMENEQPKIILEVLENNPPSECTITQPGNSFMTNNNTILFEISTATDPENNPVYYKVRACKDSTCNTIEQSSILSDSTTHQLTISEGTFYAQCVASDTMQETFGPSIQITVDKTPPTQPLLLPEPPYTKGETNTIYWEKNDATEYELEWSTRKTFSIKQTSGWITTDQFTASELPEEEIYYRLRAKDSVGNISVYSLIISSIQDHSLPAVEYFKASKEYVSPKPDDENKITDNTYIQGKMSDSHLSRVSLVIFNTNKLEVFTASTTEKDYIRQHWPESLNKYEDGVYFAYLTAEDALGNKTYSDPIKITIDTKNPPQAVITGLKNGGKYNNNSQNITILCKESSFAKLYINNRIVQEFISKAVLTLNQPDNSYTLKVLCRDAANNESLTSLSYLIDTTPPKQPTLKLEVEDKSITAEASCEYPGEISFYNNGVEIKKTPCSENKKVSQKLIENVTVGGKYSISVRASDELGNLSDPTIKDITIPVSEKVKNVTVKCTLTYNITTKENLQNCDWDNLNNLYTSLEATKYDDFTNYYFTGALTQNVQARVTVIQCAPYNFWDFRTWFTCVPFELHSTNVPVLLISSVKHKDFQINFTQNPEYGILYSLSQKTESLTLPINYKFSGFNYTSVGGIWIPIALSSPDSVQDLRYSEIKKPTATTNRPYFDWIFKKMTQVSQWHGFTKFQKPHGGIDFSVYKEQILAPAEGNVIAATYHVATKCFSGGNYVAIRHDNGLYSYYFHLNSKSVKVGQRVNRGQIIASSGNSGMYNCLPLAHHLHFEVRTSQNTKHHINPVPLINIDWKNIPTSNAKRYPDRLSGDNPHPSY
jgi:murein DD-endopeptidase MepM/ murein hydrolase activator NlpD